MSRRPPKEKFSYGIICARYINDRVEYLMVHKRLTHAFSDLVKLRVHDHVGKQVQKMLNKMTPEEKFDLSFLDFDKIWDKLWLKSANHNHKAKYDNMKTQFNEVIKYIGETQLKNMIKNSSNGYSSWEFPKGRGEGSEPNIVTAIREFYEETGITSDKYHIIDNGDRECIVLNDFVDGNTKYISKYYMAILHTDEKDFQLGKRYIDINDICEIDDCKWISINELSIMNIGNGIYTKMYNAEKYLRKKFKIKKAYEYNLFPLF